MDLRPKIAAEIVDALMDDIRTYGTPDLDRERWIAVALSKITSHNIPFPGTGWAVSCPEPEVVGAFLTKYPVVGPLLDACEAKARALWPNVVLERRVVRDPEGCSVCHEGQHLSLRVTVETFLRPDENLPDDPRMGVFEEWWSGCDLGDAADLFAVHLEIA